MSFDNALQQYLEQTNRDRMVKDYITTALNHYNTGLTKEQFYAMNIVDASDVSVDDMEAVRDGIIQFWADNGCYSALPPFEEGAFIDRSERRYFHWKVLEVQEDYYRMTLEFYPLLIIGNDPTGKHVGVDVSKLTHPCWYLAGRATIKVKVLTTAEHRELLSHLPEYAEQANALFGNDKKKHIELLDTLSESMRFANYVGGVIEDYEYYYSHDLQKIRKKGKYFTSEGEFINGAWIREVVDATLANVSERGLHSMLFAGAGPLIEMFAYINYMLANKSTTTHMHRTVSTIYAPNPDTSDVRKERHFGKFTVVSEKKPRSINAENIQRVYTAVAWQRRSHLRHCASGKVVPIKSTTCKRHGMEDTAAPQVVYKA